MGDLKERETLEGGKGSRQGEGDIIHAQRK
jgi:hypothetical protein